MKVAPAKFNIESIPAHATWEFRQRILLPHLTVDECRFTNDASPGAFHLGATRDGQLVGIASFLPELNEQLSYLAKNPFRLRQMATLPEVRRQGVGRKIIETAYSYLQLKGCELLWCHAREKAFPFYENLGFTYQSGVFEVPHIGPHRLMALEIAPID
ncbi:MAG: GNAT family N-acetyltransferase [Bdellovibrionales bacterium]|nr:GNAT family N-acetyltransferase [Bdellovibrionales bacterium]